MYPESLDLAMEAAEVFARVGECKITERFEEGANLLNDYITSGCDHTNGCEYSGRRLCHLVTTGAMVTADLVRACTSPPPGGFWALQTERYGVSIEDLAPPDLAAMRILTATLNHDHGAVQDVLFTFISEHGVSEATTVLGALIALYVATAGELG